ncbi:MAG: helix-turn-helix transcriptional regulator [Bacilli bacterium]|nr:helix-turn-helix transcriptional regulator [Bacilli bacterium]
MKINEKIYSLRKEHNLSQEELADKLNVSRQTVSKWELGDSCPDFDKIVPLCELFGISTEELLRDRKINEGSDEEKTIIDDETPDVVKALLICSSVFLYFVAVVFILLGEEFFHWNNGLVVSIFLLICGLATALIVFTCMTHPSKKKEKVEKEQNPVLKRFKEIAALITTCIYLFISFITMAWHITWIIWIIYAIVIKIIELIFDLKEINKNEE